MLDSSSSPKSFPGMHDEILAIGPSSAVGAYEDSSVLATFSPSDLNSTENNTAINISSPP
ncbi:unnamed protein product, partial [Wuchereria bancrofti]